MTSFYFTDKRALPAFLACVAFLLFFPLCLSARYDPGWEWHTVRTDDFIIYYPKGHEAFAQRVLSLCEEVKGDVAGYFGVEPRPCPIVLNPGTDIFNGYMSIFPSMISLYETPLHTFKGIGTGSDLMDLVFTHEYTHYVHITSRRGWYALVADVLGEGLQISNAVSPGWVIEGITTNTETLFTDGGRGRSNLFTGQMRSFTEGKGLWSLNSAAVSSPYSPPGSRIYLAGYHMIDYLKRTYGADAFARLSRYQAEHPLGGTAEALESVTQVSPGQFYSGFLRDFEARTEKSKDKALSPGLPSGRTVLGGDAYLDGFESHFWTKTGTIVALRKGYDTKTALVEVEPATGIVLREKPTGILANLSSRRLPDGRLVMSEVFYHPFGEGEIDSTDLVLFDPETGRRERLTRNAHIYSAVLSPDGRTFAATRRNGMWIDLVLLDPDGSNIRPLVSRPGIYFDAPCWSPDGSRIAAVVKTGRNSDIALVDPLTGAMELLFQSDAAEDNDPEFSPDGKWLVFSSDRSGIWNVYAWNFHEKRLYQLTSVPYVAEDPHFSPDGNTLSFAGTIRGVKQVCVLPFDPSGGMLHEVQPASPLSEPDLERLQPEVAFAGAKGIPLAAYKPFLHVPYVSSDEDGTQAGIFIMGADPVGINAYTLDLLYGFRSNRPGYDINLVNRSFWPTLTARIYDTSVEGDTIGGGRDFWFRERGGELSVGLNTIHRITPSSITSSFRMGPRLRHFSSLNGDIRLNKEFDQSTGVFGEMKASRKPDSAPRDMVSSWGQDLFLTYEKGLSRLGGELPGYNAAASLTQYVPSYFTHQGLALTLAHQSQKGLLFYDKLYLPRGYSDDDTEGDLDLRRNLLMTAEYHFPILYTDDGLGLMAYHSNLFKGSVFIDYGAGWEGGFDWDSWNAKARTSIGATLTNKCVLFALLPVEFGIQAGYKTHEHESFVNFLLRLEL